MIHADKNDRVEQNAGYSNFDYTFDKGCESGLRIGTTYCQHAAWNFCGWIWFEDGLFHEEIMRFGSTVDLLHNESLEELIREANDKWGYD